MEGRVLELSAGIAVEAAISCGISQFPHIFVTSKIHGESFFFQF